MRPKIYFKPERCASCGYDLAGHKVGQTCPECGNVIRHAEKLLPRIKTKASSLLDDPPRLAIYLLIFAAVSLVLAIAIYSMLPEWMIEGFERAERWR